MSDSETEPRRRRGLTFWDLVALTPWVIVIRAARAPIRDNSFLWHIRAGTVQAERGAVLTSDPFSYTFGGEPWRTQSWLADLVYGWLDDRAGLAFTPWLLGVAATLIVVGVGLAVWRVTRSRPGLAVGLLLTGLLLAPFLNPRPVLLSFILLALLVVVEQDRLLRWTLPLLFWVWASVHASFPLGGLYLVLRTLQDREWTRIRREAPAIVVAVFATAHGWGIVDFLTAFGGSGAALAQIQEWRVPDLVSWPFAPFLLGLGALMVAGIRGRMTARHLWVVLPLILMGLESTRFLFPVWVLLASVMALALLKPPKLFGLRKLAGGSVLGVVIIGLPFMLPTPGGLDRDRFAVELLARARSDRLFHDDVVGGYVIYSDWPRRQVMIDDRAELYGEFMVEFVGARAGGPEWRRFIDRVDAEEAIVSSDTALYQLLPTVGWTEIDVSSDGSYALLRRDRP